MGTILLCKLYRDKKQTVFVSRGAVEFYSETHSRIRQAYFDGMRQLKRNSRLLQIFGGIF